MPYTTAAARSRPKSFGDCCPNRFSRLERAWYPNHNVAVIVVNHHDDDIIRICCQLSMLIALEPLATVSNRPKEVHKARLQALQRYLGTRSDCEIAKVSCRIAVELV